MPESQASSAPIWHLILVGFGGIIFALSALAATVNSWALFGVLLGGFALVYGIKKVLQITKT